MKPCAKCNEKHNEWYSCQSWAGRNKSYRVTLNHRGKVYCDSHQICAKCCEVKHIMRTLNHFSGRCSKNKNKNKCHICHNTNEHKSLGLFYFERLERIYLNRQIATLYKHFFGVK